MPALINPTLLLAQNSRVRLSSMPTNGREQARPKGHEMHPSDTHLSALDAVREARKQHEKVEGTYRDVTYRAIASVARIVKLFEGDPAAYHLFLNEPFFAATSSKNGRKRDTTNKFNTVSRYVFDADSREKEKTANVYGNAAWYYSEIDVPPDDIPRRIASDGGLKEVAKLAAQVKAAKAAIVEDETWGEFIALKLWVNRKHFDRAMGLMEDECANLRIRRVKGHTAFKEFVCEKLKRIGVKE